MDKAKIISDLKYWVQQERAALEQVLIHMKLFEENRLYFNENCDGLYSYCIKHLKFSEGEASRRVSAVRIFMKVPEIGPLISEGKLNLTQINIASKYFEEEKISGKKEQLAIFKELVGKTTRETQKHLDLKKQSPPVRKINLPLLEETFDELKKLQARKAHSYPNMDKLIVDMCGVVGKVWDDELAVYRHRVPTNGDSRYVSKQLKAAVFEKYNGKCANCDSTYALEVDHIKEYALGGKTTIDNLQLLCRSCNRSKAIQKFGKKFTSASKSP